jgi:hypothetical protein
MGGDEHSYASLTFALRLFRTRLSLLPMLGRNSLSQRPPRAPSAPRRRDTVQPPSSNRILPDMQPLSRVRPNAVTHWGDPNTISSRPEIAVKIAECIAEWTEIETLLGLFLGFLLHTTPKAALAMYAGVENRASQLKMLDAAASAELPPEHYDVLATLRAVYIRPAMKERDKLAHWSWRHSPDLPDALLLTEPANKTLGLYQANEIGRGELVDVPSRFTTIFVVKEADLIRTLERFRRTKRLIQQAASTVWSRVAPHERAAQLQQLSNEPEIQQGLNRLKEARQKD